ncbi:uncharacterized protein LOC101236796 isoform X1 [Hydra vulgaris]|uniref:uncharacterized protein LOC101236796 isoform X1 n=2 Tax=Hydra vulgaris TaxID=6087 RepID=UPI001F5F54D5|nr:uncharacterized protein LOC101236796 isoform X1 [Hydra vulgaris]
MVADEKRKQKRFEMSKTKETMCSKASNNNEMVLEKFRSYQYAIGVNVVLLFASSLVFFSWKVNHFSYIDIEPKVNFLLAVTLIPWLHGAVICLVKIMGFNINIICNYIVASVMHALTSLVIFMASSILTQAIVEKDVCMDDCLQTLFCVIMGYIDSFGLLLLSYFCFKQKLNESTNEECDREAVNLDETYLKEVQHETVKKGIERSLGMKEKI